MNQFSFNLNCKEWCNSPSRLGVLMLKVIRDPDRSQYNRNACSDLLSDLQSLCLLPQSTGCIPMTSPLQHGILISSARSQLVLQYMLICLQNKPTDWLNILGTSEFHHIKHTSNKETVKSNWFYRITQHLLEGALLCSSLVYTFIEN